MNKILIIIPAYNEENNIISTCKKVQEHNYDYIVINDGSTDNTALILDENNIPHINLVFNLGIGGAVQTGYKYALRHGYDIAIQFDGDGQHDINCVKDIVEPILNGDYDFVVGSRFVDKNSSEFKSSFCRRLGINLISNVIYHNTGFRLKDTTSGFRAANKEIISLFSNQYPTEYPEPSSLVELVQKGFKIKEVPVKMYERKSGKSSINSWKNAYFMINVILSILIIKMRGEK
jgi:glycosyltransferase involved in cell wall biosynthesis